MDGLQDAQNDGQVRRRRGWYRKAFTSPRSEDNHHVGDDDAIIVVASQGQRCSIVHTGRGRPQATDLGQFRGPPSLTLRDKYLYDVRDNLDFCIPLLVFSIIIGLLTSPPIKMHLPLPPPNSDNLCECPLLNNCTLLF